MTGLGMRSRSVPEDTQGTVVGRVASPPEADQRTGADFPTATGSARRWTSATSGICLKIFLKAWACGRSARPIAAGPILKLKKKSPLKNRSGEPKKSSGFGRLRRALRAKDWAETRPPVQNRAGRATVRGKFAKSEERFSEVSRR